MNAISQHPIDFFGPWFNEPIHVTDWSVYGVVETLNQHPVEQDQDAQNYIMPIRRCRERAGRFRIYGENQDTFYCFVLEGEETKSAPPVYFESCLDFVEDYGLSREAIIDGDHVKVADSFQQFLWHILGHHICLRMNASSAYTPLISGVVFDGCVSLDETFVNPLGSEFPAGYTPRFSNDTICIPDWGAAFRTTNAAQKFLDRFSPPVSRRWGALAQ